MRRFGRPPCSPRFNPFWCGMLILASVSLPLSPEESSVIIPIDLAVEGRKMGQIQTRIHEDGTIFLGKRELVQILDRIVKKEIIDSLPKGEDPEWVSLPTLQSWGLQAGFDKTLLALSISIPSSWKRSRDILLSGTPAIQEPVTDFPEPFSLYLNLSSSLSAWYDPYLSPPTTFPVTLGIEPVLNFRGWVMEGAVSATNYPEPEVSYEYGRLVYDLEQYRTRFTLGSLGLSLYGFQSPFLLEGISLVRDYRKFEKDRILNQKVLFLERPATVKVYLNEQLVKTLYLEPGQHRLLNFPYLSGVNDLKLIIQEEQAPEVTLMESVAFDGRLQPQGENSYSLSAGFPRWEPSQGVIQGSFLYGITPWLTGGGYVQGNTERQLAGLEALFAAPLGIFLLDSALSFYRTDVKDWAGSLQYRVTFPGKQSLPSLGFGVQYRGGQFHTPGESADAPKPPRWELSGTVSKSFPFGLSVGAAATYRIVRVGSNDFRASFSALQSLRKGVSLLFSISTTLSDDGARDTRGTLSVTVSSPEGRRNTTFSSYLWEDTASAFIQVRPEIPSGTATIDGAIEGMPLGEGKASSARLSGSYSNPWLEGGVFQNVFRSSQGEVSSRTTAQIRTALVYGDGVFAFSKPIFDSYVLVIPAGEAKEETLFVTPSAGTPALAVPGSPALFLVNSYEKTRLWLDTPLAAEGFEVSRPVRVLRPTYRSGTMVRAEITHTVFVEGTLLYEDGKPVALQGGAFVALGEGEGMPQEKVYFFTDERGIFQAYGLHPGTYELRFSTNLPSVRVTIPEGESGFIQLGRILLPEKGKGD